MVIKICISVILAIVFLFTSVICGINWLLTYIGNLALIYHIMLSGQELPNDAQIEMAKAYVVDHILKDLHLKK